MSRSLITVGVLGGVALGAALLLNPFYKVDETERAVVTSWGQFSSVVDPGLHFRMPFVNNVYEYPVTNQAVRVVKAEAFTSDNQPVEVTYTVVYAIPAANVARVYREVPDYASRLQSQANFFVKSVFGRRNITEVPAQRVQIAKEILETLRPEAESRFALEVRDVFIEDMDYSPAFRQAIDQAAVVKANVERTEQQARQAEVESRRLNIEAKGQADAAIAAARGAAESRKLAAEAEANAIEVRGRAEASSILAQARALADNPAYVKLREAERWNGALPSQVLGNAPLPVFNMTPSR